MLRLNSNTPFTNDDLAWLKEGGYYDPTEADRCIKFIETYCRQSKHPFYMMPLLLTRWQRRFIRRIYGMKNKDGSNYTKVAFLYLPKKNGKSTLSAALALYVLCSVKGSQSIIVAATEDQAGIIFRECANMIELHPALSKMFKVKRSSKTIENKKTLSSIKMMSGVPTAKQGHIVSGIALLDEVSFHKACYAREVWEQIEYSQITNPNSLRIVMTTAGFNRDNNIGFELFRKGEDILKGVRSEPGFLPIMYYVADDEDYTNPDIMVKANPSVGTTYSKASLIADYDKVKDSPIELVKFQVLRLNMWRGFSLFVPSHVWAGCEKDIKEEDYKDWQGVISVDSSQRHDLTAISVMLRKDDQYVNFPRFFMPRMDAYNKGLQDGIPYDRHATAGHIFLNDGNAIDPAMVRQQIIEDMKRFPNVKKVYFDASHFTESSLILMEMGIECIEVPQTATVMSTPTAFLEKTIRTGKLISKRNPVLANHFANVHVKTLPDNSIKIEKSRQKGRVDGVVAMVIGMAGLAELQDGPEIDYTPFII